MCGVDDRSKPDEHLHADILLSSGINHQQISLDFDSLLEFDQAIQRGYHTWVENAPESWKEDNFFVERSPICVISRYGQNQKLGSPRNLEEQSTHWYRHMDFGRIRYINVAIATHLWFVAL